MLLGFASGVSAQEAEGEGRVPRPPALDWRAPADDLQLDSATAAADQADEGTERPMDLVTVRQRIAETTLLLERMTRELAQARAALEYTDPDAAELRNELTMLEKLTLEAREGLAHRLEALPEVKAVMSTREGLLMEVQELRKRERLLRRRMAEDERDR